MPQVMEGSVRRNNSQSVESRSLTSRHHQLHIRFMVHDFVTLGSDLPPREVSLAGVPVKVAVRPKEKLESFAKSQPEQYYEIRRNRDVELVLQTPGIVDNTCIWSEHTIRSSLPGTPSLRSKLCQIYSTSNPRWACRLARWDTLTDPRLGYLDTDGAATILVSLDMDPCIKVR